MENLDDTQPQKPVDATQVLHDTQPKRPENFPPQGQMPPQPRRPPQGPPSQYAAGPPPPDYYYDQGGVAAPPRILFWGVIFLFVLSILGAVGSVYAFREVLTPGQQVRVIGYLPFMESLLPARPGAGDTVPTSSAPVAEEEVEGILNLNLGGDDSGSGVVPGGVSTTPDANAADVGTPAEMTEEPTAEALETTEEAVSMMVTEPFVAEIVPTPTPTEAPTLEPTPIPPTPTSQEAVSVAQAAPVDANTNTSVNALPDNIWNAGFRHERQTWNNCGPANITMALSYYGWTQDQSFAASYLKPEREDKNVSPDELVEFVNTYSDINALARMGGDLQTLQVLLANGFPVIIERSHMFEGYEWIGHYQTLVGYNDTSRIFYIYDSFLGNGDDGSGHIETFDEVDADWQAFNRTFIVVYEPQREQLLMNLLDDLADPIQAAELAFEVAQEEARANPQNGFAWFNMGSALTELGRFEEGSLAFDRAFDLGVPWRMLWYQFGPFEAYYEVGRYEDVLNYVSNNLSNGGEWVEETYYWQGRALAAQGDAQAAANAFRQALSRNRLFEDAQQALDRLS